MSVVPGGALGNDGASHQMAVDIADFVFTKILLIVVLTLGDNDLGNLKRGIQIFLTKLVRWMLLIPKRPSLVASVT